MDRQLIISLIDDLIKNEKNLYESFFKSNLREKANKIE